MRDEAFYFNQISQQAMNFHQHHAAPVMHRLRVPPGPSYRSSLEGQSLTPAPSPDPFMRESYKSTPVESPLLTPRVDPIDLSCAPTEPLADLGDFWTPARSQFQLEVDAGRDFDFWLKK